MIRQTITANRLIDGAVVYFTTDHTWSIDINESCLVDDEQAAVEFLAAAHPFVEQNVILDPYLIDVDHDDAAIKPLRYREIIRAMGPSTQLGEIPPSAVAA